MYNNTGISIDSDEDRARTEINRAREDMLSRRIEAYYVRIEGNRVFIEVYEKVKRQSLPLVKD